jgi:hypothetical protein
MAIRAQELQVLEPVVVAVAVYMMKLKRQRTSAPLAQSASLASRVLECGVEQPQFDVVTTSSPPVA